MLFSIQKIPKIHKPRPKAHPIKKLSIALVLLIKKYADIGIMQASNQKLKGSKAKTSKDPNKNETINFKVIILQFYIKRASLGFFC